MWRILKVSYEDEYKQHGDVELQKFDNSNQGNQISRAEIAELIQEGSSTFLRQEYKYTLAFVIFFSVVIFLTAEQSIGFPYTTVAFIVGAVTSMLSGYIGMWIAVRANVRTAKKADESLNDAFFVAFRGGMVLGFVLVGLALFMLMLLIIIYKSLMGEDLTGSENDRMEGYLKLFESIAGYGLGGSTVALFGRVGGGIYTKAADVGADLVGKVVEDLDEDSI